MCCKFGYNLALSNFSKYSKLSLQNPTLYLLSHIFCFIDNNSILLKINQRNNLLLQTLSFYVYLKKTEQKLFNKSYSSLYILPNNWSKLGFLKKDDFAPFRAILDIT